MFKRAWLNIGAVLFFASLFNGAEIVSAALGAVIFGGILVGVGALCHMAWLHLRLSAAEIPCTHCGQAIPGFKAHRRHVDLCRVFVAGGRQS